MKTLTFMVATGFIGGIPIGYNLGIVAGASLYLD